MHPTLAMEALQLQSKDWVELIPVGPGNTDMGAITSKFFLPKGISKAIQFQSKKVLQLYLELACDRYAEILMHLEDMDNRPVCLIIYSFINTMQIHISMVSNHNILKAQLKVRTNQFY